MQGWVEAACNGGITLGCAGSADSHIELLGCQRAGDLQPLFLRCEKHWVGEQFAAARGQPLLKGSAGFMKCAFLPKGSCLITGPSAVDNSSVFMVMTEESNLQPVAGKFRATQG